MFTPSDCGGGTIDGRLILSSLPRRRAASAGLFIDRSGRLFPLSDGSSHEMIECRIHIHAAAIRPCCSFVAFFFSSWPGRVRVKSTFGSRTLGYLGPGKRHAGYAHNWTYMYGGAQRKTAPNLSPCGHMGRAAGHDTVYASLISAWLEVAGVKREEVASKPAVASVRAENEHSLVFMWACFGYEVLWTPRR
jgi:hypothetical protein